MTGNHPNTGQRIVEAATALFYEKGYHGTTMREVAAAVNIKAGSLYNHYSGKQELLRKIASGTMEELLEGGKAVIASHAEPREQLRALVIWHVRYHALRRFQARVADEQLHALEPDHRHDVVRVRDEYAALFKEILEAGRRAHGWNVPNVPVITFAIAGMCTFVDTWYRDGGQLTAEEIGATYADFILDGLEGGRN